MALLKLILDPLVRIFDFKGRESRLEYFVGLISITLIGSTVFVGLKFLSQFILTPNLANDFLSILTGTLLAIYFIILASMKIFSATWKMWISVSV